MLICMFGTDDFVTAISTVVGLLYKVVFETLVCLNYSLDQATRAPSCSLYHIISIHYDSLLSNARKLASIEIWTWLCRRGPLYRHKP